MRAPQEALVLLGLLVLVFSACGRDPTVEHPVAERLASGRFPARVVAGPGELSIPPGLALDGNRLFVGDERRVIHEFRRESGEWRWARDVPVDFLVLDLCAMQDALYALGVSESDEAVIHELEADGTSPSFGVQHRQLPGGDRFRSGVEGDDAVGWHRWLAAWPDPDVHERVLPLAQPVRDGLCGQAGQVM